MRYWFTMFVLVILLVLASCSTQSSPPPAAAINGTEWSLQSLRGEVPIEGQELTLKFEGENAGGSAGCNTFGGSYSTGENNSLSFSNLYQTEMACMEPQGVMEQETAYLQTLSEAASYQIIDGRLEIANASGEVILTYTAK